MKAPAVVGKGEKSLLSDPGSELRLGRENEGKKKVRSYYIWDIMIKKNKKGLVAL